MKQALKIAARWGRPIINLPLLVAYSLAAELSYRADRRRWKQGRAKP